ncbi:PH domain-like protein [Xylariaceae sp. FL0594]|nr:PH domain-like protein [Xylariaceae sp. FL0594]
MITHGHSPGHGKTRPRQLQGEGQRRQRQQQQQNPQKNQPTPLGVTSDYESDTAQYMASHPAMPPTALAGRTNTELNLAVLRRYLPSITNVLSIAANAVVYTFQPPSEWKRSTMEGTMFICSQRRSPNEPDTGCLFILNRKGLLNFIIPLDTVSDFELAGDLLIFKLHHPVNTIQLETGEMVTPDVIGLWTYAEDKNDRELNATLIQDMWAQALEAKAQAAAATVETVTSVQAIGRKVSLTELFSTSSQNHMSAAGP